MGEIQEPDGETGPDPAVTAAWIILAGLGAWLLLGAVWVLVVSPPFEPPMPPGIRLLITLPMAAMGAAFAAVALKVRQRRTWSRWVGIVLAGLVAAGSTQSVFAGLTWATIRDVAFGTAALFVIVVLVRHSAHFREDPPPADNGATTLRERWSGLSRRTRLTAVVVAVAAAGGWLWWTSAGPEISGHIASEEMTCMVAHDGWLWPQREHTVPLEAGSNRFDRWMGPHQVALEVVDEGGQRHAIRYEIKARMFLGGGTSRMGDWHDYRISHRSVGLGQLEIRCIGEPPPEPPTLEVETDP